MAYYTPTPDPVGELVVEELHPRCVEVWFIPDDDRLMAAGLKPDDRLKHRVNLMLISAQDKFISVFPTGTLPSKPNFMRPKYAQVREITIEDTDLWDVHYDEELPKTHDDVLEMLREFPSGFTKDPDYGLGLAKDYRFIIESVEQLSNCTSLVISKKETTHINEKDGIFYISNSDFEKMRRKINSITCLLYTSDAADDS